MIEIGTLGPQKGSLVDQESEQKRFGRANRNDGSRAWRSTSSIAEVRTAIEYEYRFAEYRFAEYEYDEKIV
jgi:hypothetical protein